MTGPLPPNFRPIGAAAQAVVARAQSVRDIGDFLAVSGIDLDDRARCLELLTVQKGPVPALPFDPVEVLACFEDALEGARARRQQMEARHASV
ncbi:hypothetical protein ACN6KF_001502 [Labrys sp. La1]|uniref:hypothetical protein n=1 Tax=Labrys sp. La1 TaxID=3404917 RepID=UPI003EC12BB8